MAKTILQKFHGYGKLVVSFFCAPTINCNSVFPILAIQLARKFPRFRSNFVQVIPSVTEPLGDRMLEQLILNPLNKSRFPKTVIVIDGLELYDYNGKNILTCLEEAKSEIKNANVKFIITCSPTLKIPPGLRPDSVSESFVLREKISSWTYQRNIFSQFLICFELYLFPIANCTEPIWRHVVDRDRIGLLLTAPPCVCFKPTRSQCLWRTADLKFTRAWMTKGRRNMNVVLNSGPCRARGQGHCWAGA